MSSLAMACLLHVVLLLPVVAAGTWSWHRYSAPLLLDTIDADEMVVGAVHRWTTVTYTLLALGFTASQAPTRHDLAGGAGGAGAAVLSSWATVVCWLGVAHGAALWLLLRHRRRRQQVQLAAQVWGPLPRPAPPTPIPPAVRSGGPGYARGPMAPASPFGAPPFGAPPFAAAPYGAPPFAAAPFGTVPFGAAPPGPTGPGNVVANPYAWPPPHHVTRRC